MPDPRMRHEWALACEGIAQTEKRQLLIASEMQVVTIASARLIASSRELLWQVQKALDRDNDGIFVPFI